MSNTTSATFKDILASCIGSSMCVYSGQPFDTIKVRMQVQPGEFTSPIDCFKKTFKGEGLTSFWKGSLPALIGALSENAVAFGVNGALKRLISSFQSSVSTEKPSVFEPFLTGGFTGGCTAFVLCPCDVVKCRAQINRVSGKPSSIASIVRSTLKSQGLSGFYTGIGAQICRDIPFYATFFGVYDTLCRWMKLHTNLPEASVFFLSGGLAGQVAWVVSIAPDVIKSKIQTSAVPLTMIEAFRDVIRTRGVRGMFAGVEVAIIRAFPANAALFVGYEYSRKYLEQVF